jgi:hypothetical protein
MKPSPAIKEDLKGVLIENLKAFILLIFSFESY